MPTHTGGQVGVLREGFGSSRTCWSNTRLVRNSRRPGLGSTEAANCSNGHREANKCRNFGHMSVCTTSTGNNEMALSETRNATGRQNFGASACAASVTQLNVSKALLRLSTSNCNPQRRFVNLRFSARSLVGVSSSTHCIRATHTFGHSCKAKRCKAYSLLLSSVTKTPCSLRCKSRIGGNGQSMRWTPTPPDSASERNLICSMISEMGPRAWKKGWIFSCEKRTRRGQIHRSSQTMPSSCTFRMVSSGNKSCISDGGPHAKLPKAAWTALPRSAFSLGGVAPTLPFPSPPPPLPRPFHSAPCCRPPPSHWPSALQPFQDDHSHHLSLLPQPCSDQSQPSFWCSFEAFRPVPFCAFSLPPFAAASFPF